MAALGAAAVSQIEAALARDDVGALSATISALGLRLGAYYDWATPKHGQQARDLLAMAASAAAPVCVAALLGAGAEPNAASPSDGNTALHCACSSAGSSTARIIALLVRAGADKLLPNASGATACDLLTQETSQAPAEPAAAPDSGDLLLPQYSTDEFRMFSFKIDCCPRLAESHDWTLCPFQHPGEKARRRDPRCYRYQGVPCPDFRKGTCKRGDACTYAHGVFECWLHPSRYRTQLCKEGAACRRSVCFFAHAVDQLREPTMTAVSDLDSPRGHLLPGEESQDTPRSWSPAPATSEDSVKLVASSTESIPSLPRSFPAALPAGLPQGAAPFLGQSADSSLSSTPVLEGSMCSAGSASFGSLGIERTLSSLSLSSEDMSQMAMLQQVAAGTMPGHHAALLAATASNWPLAGGDALALAAAAGAGPLAAGLQSMLLPDAATVQAAVQAAAVQHQLAVLQAGAGGDAGGLLGPAATNPLLGAAAAGARQPLHPLSLNLGGFHAAAPAVPTCFSGGL